MLSTPAGVRISLLFCGSDFCGVKDWMGDDGFESCGLIGREKLIDARATFCLIALPVSIFGSCGVVGKGGGLLFGLVPLRSRLTPLPPCPLGTADSTLCGGSALEGRRTSSVLDDALPLFKFLGRAGSGGRCSERGVTGLEGESPLKILSVIEPLLPLRRSVLGPPEALPIDDTDARRCVRLVWTSLTGVGEVTWVRSAAAAADEERLAFEARSARNACAAAVAAAAVVGVFRTA